MGNQRTSVGLDVHARSVVAAAVDEVTGVWVRCKLTPSFDDVLAWLVLLPAPVAVVYEAGPTGFGLYRTLVAQGISCVVAAPSKLQRPAGDRVKTDGYDAEHLARLLRLGEITPVAVPTLEQETARDLVRAREDCRGDLMRARHRLSKLLLRHGQVYYGGAAWTGKHDMWLRGEARGALPDGGTKLAFDAGYETVHMILARRDGLDKQIAIMAVESQYAPVVARLGCLRGISTLTGFALAVEIGDWQRMTGRTIGSFVGLTPSEHSSGASRSQGPITKTGNGHVRRLLIEAAWHHRAHYTIGSTLRARWDAAPAAARARGDDGNRRLHKRWVSFIDRKKRSTVANTAIARELAGWCWSLAVMDQ
jgi:transposase